MFFQQQARTNSERCSSNLLQLIILLIEVVYMCVCLCVSVCVYVYLSVWDYLFQISGFFLVIIINYKTNDRYDYGTISLFQSNTNKPNNAASFALTLTFKFKISACCVCLCVWVWKKRYSSSNYLIQIECVCMFVFVYLTFRI